MHLMVYYQNKDDFSMLKNIVNNLSLDVTFAQTKEIDKAKLMFESNDFDLVFIDFEMPHSQELLDCIFELDVAQRIILLNSQYTCYDGKNCKACQKEHNVATVIKPINLFQIAHLLKDDFQCESYMKKEKEFNLEKIVKSVLHKYPFVPFDKKKYLFDLTTIVNPLKTSILIELIEVLSKNGIEHHLFDDTLHIVDIST